MNPPLDRSRRALGLIVLLALSACSHDDVEANGAVPRAGQPIHDKEIESYRLDLLDTAFAAASAMPLDPHVKNRGRAQDEVVSACFALGLPERALGYADRIVDWRRGTTYAEYAILCAEKGLSEEAEDYLARAESVAAETHRDPNQQEWRSDRIRAGIARARYLLGQTEAAAKIETALEPSQRGEVEATKASLTGADRFDAQLEAADAVFDGRDLDQSKAAFDALLTLFDRCFDDQARRAQVESRLRSGFPRYPLGMRLELLLKAGDVALAHGDHAKATDLADAARSVMDLGQWLAEQRIPLMARVSALCARAGDREHATKEIDAALALFDSERAKIVDIRRASALRPVAEACIDISDLVRAAKVYGMALDEGSVNPNARPRADDLVATCCSMALRGFQPDAALLGRISAIRTKLVDPW